MTIKDSFQKTILKNIKKMVAKGEYTLAQRDKNIEFMRNYFLDDDDLKEIILDLSLTDCIGGPEADEGGFSGYVTVYKSSYIIITTIYIKIRYNPPEDVVIISFHEDEDT